jgi:FkbM family methyltransferase
MSAVATHSAEGNVDERVRARFFPNERAGILIEVGAAHPEFLSIGALYRELGWRVISVEPNPEFCALHRLRGHEVLEYACGDHDEDDVEFSIVDSAGVEYKGGNVSYESFSSLAIKDSYASLVGSELSVRKIRVDLRRLDSLLAEHASNVDHVDILTIDVEGWELEVLDGLDTDRFQPRVLIVENLFAEARYRQYLRQRGYVLWRYVQPNDVYVREGEIQLGDRIARAAATVSTRAARASSSLAARITRRAGS